MSPIEKLMNTVGQFVGLADPPCGHKWRPCLTSRGPGRYCGICGVLQDLNEGQFYAHFGRIPRA